MSFAEQMMSKDKIISKHIFQVKWNLLCLLFFTYFLQHAEFLKFGNISSLSCCMFSHVFSLGNTFSVLCYWLSQTTDILNYLFFVSRQLGSTVSYILLSLSLLALPASIHVHHIFDKILIIFHGGECCPCQPK